MALKATVFKAELQVSDMDRSYFQSHSLTLARHPSETDERMMVRLLAFALNAHFSLNTGAQLQFTKGLSSDDEPDLWLKNLHGDIEHWIEVGLPDERRIRKGCNRANRVTIYAYGERSATIWWKKIEADLNRFDNLSIYYLSPSDTAALAEMAERNMSLQATVQDGAVWFGNTENTRMISPETWKASKLENR
ncbi:MAG: YaeQ family protein [Porticoccus sp.]|nr:YaeQ family protein [Porticoccus sp.]MBQ0807779.1 YaeQ family protein [Porticoccus sp.]